MYCNNCGRKLSEDAFFCSNCGTPVARQGLITPQDDDMFEDTMIFSQDEMDKALENTPKESKSEKPVETPVQKSDEPVRPAWLDEKDDPAIYENVKDPDAPEVTPQDKKPEKAALFTGASASMAGFFKKMQGQAAEGKQKREADAEVKRAAAKEKEKQRVAKAEVDAKKIVATPEAGKEKPAKDPLFKKPVKKAPKKPVSPEEKEITETFIFMYIGVVIVGLIIGVVLGLFIIRPWQTPETEAVTPPAAVVQMAPMGDGVNPLRV